jgi:pilus assembly protein CpaE
MRSLLIILSLPDREAWAQSLASAAGITEPLILVTSPDQAANYLADHGISPSHIVLDIGNRGRDILEEIDLLANQCEPGTRVIAVGDTNDIKLYRDIIARGVIDYVPMPADAADVLRPLTAPPVTTSAASKAVTASSGKRVIVFMSAASGDGASTAALNTAYAMSQLHGGSTVLVDMDYQFGMVAKNLSLQSQYGIRDLFDFPGRGVDITLIRRMVANYGKLHVITAPSELRFLPTVSAESINELIATLQQTYDNIVIDLPHVWLPWVAEAAKHATHLVLVAQLWLKSVSHAARLMRSFRDIGIGPDHIVTVINRSGAKFKEAIELKDFERVCSTTVRYTLNNDIKTIVAAEASATTIMELPPSDLARDIERLTRGLCGMELAQSPAQVTKRSTLFSRKG